MIIQKTIPAIQGNLIYSDQIAIDVKNETFTRGFILNNQNYSGTIDLSDIFSELTPTEIDTVKKFIKIGTYKSGNVGVEPDTPLILIDITDELT